MDAVILAAGRGKRLRPLTDDTPKPLIQVAGKALLEHTFNALPDCIDRVLLIVGYRAECIRKAIGSFKAGRKVDYLDQTQLNGTADAVHLAHNHTKTPLLVLNGDDLYKKQDLERLCKHDRGLLVKTDEIHPPGTRALVENEKLLGFSQEKTTPPVKICGAYMLDEAFFEATPVPITCHKKTEYSLPHTLAKQAPQIPVNVIEATFWMPVGTHKQLSKARRTFDKRDSL